MKYEELSKIDVSKYVEKKNQLTYLSWAWAVDQLLRHDPQATWVYPPHQVWGETVMVFCTVTAFGKSMTAQLPVMDYRNKAIANPDAFAVNTAMQRCLAKAIALHGIGLYIYAGEDIPMSDEPASSQQKSERSPIKVTDHSELTALKEKLKNLSVSMKSSLSKEQNDFIEKHTDLTWQITDPVKYLSEVDLMKRTIGKLELSAHAEKAWEGKQEIF